MGADMGVGTFSLISCSTILPENAVEAEEVEANEDEEAVGTGGISDGEDASTGSGVDDTGAGLDFGSGFGVTLSCSAPFALVFAFSRICFAFSPSFPSVGHNSRARSYASAASSNCSSAARAQALR